MILSRVKPAFLSRGKKSEEKEESGSLSSLSASSSRKAKKSLPRLETFLENRDYTGALALLEFQRSSRKQSSESVEPDLWIGYCAFHLGDYKRAMMEYEALLHGDRTLDKKTKSSAWLSLACCLFFLGMYEEAESAAAKSDDDSKASLKTRLRFHLSHKFGDEKRLMGFHQQLEDVVEDQLCLASIHYLRSHYQEAIDIYKKLLLDHREAYLALNVYVALCYYKLDYYDVSQEVLAVYLQQQPNSVIALNLKACNHFRLYNGKAAEQELKTLQEQIMANSNDSTLSMFGKELIEHNLVVFRGGEGALQLLPSLVDVVPEARLNLVIYFLKQDDVNEAHALIKDLEPTVPQEYILKGVVNAAVGQETGSREHLKIAQQYFQLVGGSASECDTIPGRQCMAACFFLLKQFDDVLLYLNSIKSYYDNDDTFNFNFAQAKAALGHYEEAESKLLHITNEAIRSEYTFISWLTRCHIMTRKPKMAWELYLAMETSGESFALLQLIANDCYRMGQFYYACKAFDLLERLDPRPEYWEGKRGSAVGLLQVVMANRLGETEVMEDALQAENTGRQHLADVLQMIKANMQNGGQSAQAEDIAKAIRNWARDNRLHV